MLSIEFRNSPYIYLNVIHKKCQSSFLLLDVLELHQGYLNFHSGTFLYGLGKTHIMFLKDKYMAEESVFWESCKD